MCLIITLLMAYFAITSLMAGDMTAGILQGVIALLFLLLLIRTVYVTAKERQGCSVGGCSVTKRIAELFGRSK